MTTPETLKTPAADMTVQQHLAINLMIPVSGCEELDRMIWEAKRDHIAAQILATVVGSETEGPYSEFAEAAYLAADAQLAASGWDMGEQA